MAQTQNKVKLIPGATDENAKKRYTHDGRRCASRFGFEGKIYTDCTSDKSPDNAATGAEWCYVDSDQGLGQNNQNWGYCKEILDFDKVRMKCRDILLELIIKTRQTASAISAEISPTSKTIGEIEQIQKDQQAVNSRLAVALDKMPIIKQNWEYLYANKDIWEKLNEELQKLLDQINDLKVQIASRGPDPTDCLGMLGYESEGSGDGIQGFYYDNENFEGTFVKQIDRQININLVSESPTDGINFENFSIQWVGWLRVPKSGKYTFIAKSDDGHSVMVNGQTVISHQMAAGDSWLTAGTDNLRSTEPGEELDLTKSQSNIETRSKPIQLLGGQKYQVVYKMYHTVSNELKDSGYSYAYLKWSSDDINDEIIKPEYWYTKSSVPPTKINEFDPATYQLSQLEENEDAFKGDQTYKMQDIPLIYQGSAMLKTVKKFTNKEIKFGCTSAISLFVAVAQEPKTDVWSPFGADQKFINTNDVMSVLKVNPNAKSHRIGTSDSRNAIIAEESIKYQIFRKQQGSGEAVIPVDHKGQGVDMIIFFKGDPTVKEPPSCGGNEEIISGPKNKHLVSVSESNKISGEGWGAKQGFANQPTEPEGTANTWSVEKGGLGAFIEASFDIEYRVTKFEVFQRLKEEDRISKIKICFGQMCENAESFVLKNTPGSQVFTLDEPQQTKKVRLQIEGVFGQGKAGGKFNIYGVGCVSNDDSSLSQNTPGGSGNNKAGSFDPKKVQDLECQDSIKSNDDLMAAQFKVGDKFKVKCANACGSKKNIPIYGTNIYSSDSSICKAAVHSGVVPNQDNQKFDVTIVACPTEFESKNTDADPIQSLSKAGCSGDDFAIQFLPGDLDELAVKAIKVGRLVDVEYNGKWVPGVVQIVDVVSPRQVYCTVTINGDVPKQVKVVWPSNNIAYCGDKLSSRVCDDASKNPNAGPDAVRISFGRDPIEGWIHENGGVFGERNGQEYGWEKDATAAARSRTANGNSLLDNLILFAPDKQSQWCNGEIEGTVSCEENRWRVKVEPGTYKVKITFGDSEISARHDLIVNDKPVFGGFLKEDQFETWDDEELDCLSGEILISSACPNEAGKQCKYSWSRISAIEFSKVVRAEASQEQKPPETIDTGCGEAVKGGRCQASEDVENCLFTDLQAKGVEFCTGAFKIYHIPQHYICVDQRGSFKCTRHTFKDKDECNVKCVGSCAKKGREYECLAHNSQKKHHHLNS